LIVLFTTLYLIIAIIFNPVSLNFLFENQMTGKFFTISLLFFDFIFIFMAYLTYKSKKKAESFLIFFTLTFLIIVGEFSARKLLYDNKEDLNYIFSEPVFFEYERKNFIEKFYSCTQKKANFYHKLYFFSAPKNIDCDGWSTIKSSNGPWIRNTVNFSNISNKKNIWFFGGSSLFNGVVADKDTIPSIFTKKLNENNNDYYVENYAVSGLDLHYEVSNFINLLRFTNNPPEIVVFFDGYNDIFNKIKHGGEFFIHNFFNSLMYDQNNLHKSIYYFSETISNYSVVFKNSLGKKIRSFNIKRLKKETTSYSVEEIYKDFLNSIKLANDIANLNNIEIFFHLQPTTFSRKNPVGIEQKHHSTNNSKTAREVYNMIKQEITLSNFYDLSNIFDSYEDQFFYDYGHFGKKGNLIISDKMYKIIFDQKSNIN
jgi:hypothetical protein